MAHIDTNRRDREIVSSIVSLGHALGTDVVVEGVETEVAGLNGKIEGLETMLMTQNAAINRLLEAHKLKA